MEGPYVVLSCECGARNGFFAVDDMELVNFRGLVWIIGDFVRHVLRLDFDCRLLVFAWDEDASTARRTAEDAV